jgi:hypothetical protein
MAIALPVTRRRRTPVTIEVEVLNAVAMKLYSQPQLFIRELHSLTFRKQVRIVDVDAQAD